MDDDAVLPMGEIGMEGILHGNFTEFGDVYLFLLIARQDGVFRYLFICRGNNASPLRNINT